MSISEEDLLNMAKGVTETPEQTEVEELKERYTSTYPSSKEILQVRKEMRKEILQMNFWAAGKVRGTEQLITHALKKGYEEEKWSDKRKAIFELIDEQLDLNNGLGWETFTHNWDLHPRRQSEIIRKEFWSKEGGQFDEIGACFPIAFTGQEYD